MSEVCIDSYSNIYGDGSESLIGHFLDPSGGGEASGQSFKPTKCYTLTKAEFYLRKYGSPTGNAHARLYAHTGTFGVDGYPTGPVLAVSDGLDVSALTTSFTLQTFTFSGVQQYLMSEDTVYCIVYCNPDIGDGTISNSHHVRFRYASTVHTHDGIRCIMSDAVWSADSIWQTDAVFYVYGIETDCVNTDPSCVDAIFKLYIDDSDPPTTERYYMNIHYTKSHPNQDPDTFEIIVDPDVGSLINYFDRVKITKYNVTEFYGFVEEITPTVGEDGLEYRLTGRCWKLMTWKKWTERFQESREIGPVDTEGNIESGFFGQVKPEELLKFVLRCPTSEHPKGKVRHKIGWGIPSDLWSCCASVTAECRYADWVGLRYAGLAWRNRGTVDTLVDYTLDVDVFVLEYQEWFTDGANPWIDSDGGGFIHTDAGTGSPYRMKYFTFEDFGVDPQSITNVYLNLDMFGEYWGGRIEVYLWDGAWQYLGKYQIGKANYEHNLTTIDVTQYLDTVDKVKNARVYFVRFDQLWMAIDHCYLTVKASLVADPVDQRIGDYFIVNLGKSYDDVTAILIECRNNPTMYARNYNIQYAIISDCCVEGGNDAQWTDFDPPINETNNDVRDILHSWKPQDDVHCLRIKLTGNADYPWEISQIYIWQSDTYKYRVLDEGD